jgi:hypothetical protein
MEPSTAQCRRGAGSDPDGVEGHDETPEPERRGGRAACWELIPGETGSSPSQARRSLPASRRRVSL